MTPLCAERVLQLHCYADGCRRRQAWRRLLESAPVYQCTGGCGTSREIHELGRRAQVPPPASKGDLIRMMRSVDFSFDRLDSRRAAGWNRHDRPAAAEPFCGCCGASCLLVKGSPVRRCVCDPFALPCIRCSRGACHCRCRNSNHSQITQEKL